MKNAADGLRKAYPDDLKSYLYDELVQFSCLLNKKCSGINEAVWYVAISLGKGLSQN